MIPYIRNILIVSILFIIPFSSSTFASSGFQDLIPEISITKEFNQNVSMHQDKTYEFSVSRDSILKQLKSAIRKKALSMGENSSSYAPELISIMKVDWYLVDSALSKNHINKNFPDLVKNTEDSTGIKISTVRYPFYVPTDPSEGYMLVVKIEYRWNVLKNSSPVMSPQTSTGFAKLHLKIMDLVPPKNFSISPVTLYGFCGKKLSQFNTIAADEEITGIFPQNPEYIVIKFFDDNPNGLSPDKGYLHSYDKTNAFILFETWITEYVRKNKTKFRVKNDYQGLGTILNEVPKSSYASGSLKWSLPIPVKDIPGHVIEVENFGPEKGKLRTGIKMIIPVKGLEEYFKTKMEDFYKLPLHFASFANMRSLDNNFNSLPEKYLRYTFALSDSSGNMIIPSSKIISDNDVRNNLNTIYASINAGNTEPVIREHSYYGKLFILDNIKPNPAVIMTNSRTKKSCVFTLENSDLSPDPYSNDLEEWVFSPSGNTEAMNCLSNSQKKKMSEMLNISENDRLTFQILAYDNISRDITGTINSGNYGISTPLVGDASNPDLLRFQTYKIKDPSSISEDELIEEKKGNLKIYSYPDYIFRGTSSSEQSISFIVHDFSLFRNKVMVNNRNYNPSTELFSIANRRAVKLIFKVKKYSTNIEKMTNSEEIDREN